VVLIFNRSIAFKLTCHILQCCGITFRGVVSADISLEGLRAGGGSPGARVV